MDTSSRIRDRVVRGTLLWVATLALVSLCFVTRVESAPPSPALDSICEEVNYLFPLSAVTNPTLHIFKGTRRLMVVLDNTLIRNYPIGLGPAPKGDKEVQGDGRTPEGEFFVCNKNPNSKYYKSLWLSYPNLRHAENGFTYGNLTHEQYEGIKTANRLKQRPPWNTALGGQICIHGGGAHKDWTDGCIALYNSDMDDLFRIVPVGTPVRIHP